MKKSQLFQEFRPSSLAGWLAGWLVLGFGSWFCSSSKAPSPPPAPVSPPTTTTPTVPASSATPVPVRPEALAGDWLFEVTRGGNSTQYSLHFAITSGILAGSLTGPDGNAQELTKIALKDDKVAWDIEGDSGVFHYDGAVSGTSMKGTLKRSRGQGRQGNGSSGGSDSSASGATGGFGGRRGRGGRGRGAGTNQQITWSAYKSVAPQGGESASPAVTPTPSSH